jgi:hypothetical protein
MTARSLTWHLYKTNTDLYRTCALYKDLYYENTHFMTPLLTNDLIVLNIAEKLLAGR